MDKIKTDEKIKQADVALQKAASYVAATQPLLDEYNEFKDRFIKRAHQVVGVLVNRGVVQKTKANGLVDKMANDPAYALEVVQGVAELITPARMGSTGDVKIASHVELDPFERLAITGSSSGQVEHSGMVD